LHVWDTDGGPRSEDRSAFGSDKTVHQFAVGESQHPTPASGAREICELKPGNGRG
jgi:hypothetical protein